MGFIGRHVGKAHDAVGPHIELLGSSGLRALLVIMSAEAHDAIPATRVADQVEHLDERLDGVKSNFSLHLLKCQPPMTSRASAVGRR